MKLIILRQVVGLSPEVESYLEDHGQLVEYDDGTQWVDNDQPRSQPYTDEIMLHTGHFAVADPNKEIVGGPYASLARAEQARAGAKIQLSVEVELPDEDGAEAEAAPTRSKRQAVVV